jgi:hypothetical protein
VLSRSIAIDLVQALRFEDGDGFIESLAVVGSLLLPRRRLIGFVLDSFQMAA